jgi:hypothetical protein
MLARERPLPLSSEKGILLATANEQLRQEAAAFDAQLKQYEMWMRARRAMLWTGICLLPAVMVISSLILLFHEAFTTTTVSAAGGALFVDAVGIIGAVWKGTMSLETPSAPAAVTKQPNVGAEPSSAKNAEVGLGSDQSSIPTPSEPVEPTLEDRTNSQEATSN